MGAQAHSLLGCTDTERKGGKLATNWLYLLPPRSALCRVELCCPLSPSDTRKEEWSLAVTILDSRCLRRSHGCQVGMETRVATKPHWHYSCWGIGSLVAHQWKDRKSAPVRCADPFTAGDHITAATLTRQGTEDCANIIWHGNCSTTVMSFLRSWGTYTVLLTFHRLRMLVCYILSRVFFFFPC